MNIQKIPTEIADMARGALVDVEDSLEHGRDVLVDKKDEGLASMSSMFDKGARGMETLRSAALAYASINALGSAIKRAAPGRTMLGLMGLQRRPSLFARVAMGAGFFAAGAAVGVGVTLLLAPMAGADTRARIAKRFKSVRHEAEGVVRNAESAAQGAVESVEGAARNAAHEVGETLWNLGTDGTKPPTGAPLDGASTARARIVAPARPPVGNG
jgi:YtxH-like protein